jgi:hypothetical protein
MAAKSINPRTAAIVQPLRGVMQDPKGENGDRPNTGERLDERGMRRQTLYLPPEVYEQIRDIVINDRISQQEFFRQAINLAFKSRNLKTWRELAPSKKKR